MNELVIPYADGLCILGVLAMDAARGDYVLGDTVLRSAYVVYDLAKHEISIAQKVFNSTEDRVVELTNRTAVPGEPGAGGLRMPATAVGGV
jgi:hypothetical protein